MGTLTEELASSARSTTPCGIILNVSLFDNDQSVLMRKGGDMECRSYTYKARRNPEANKGIIKFLSCNLSKLWLAILQNLSYNRYSLPLLFAPLMSTRQASPSGKRQTVACTSCQIKRVKVGNKSNNLELANIYKLGALGSFRAMGVREQTLSAITIQERINIGRKLSKTPIKPRRP